ncbi:hypothetical protein NL676_018806 [Syzygium grande]|nr:hypothetical protein NL676_018806 [Syzygium grande]
MERSAWPKNLSSSHKHAIQEHLHGQNPTKKLRHLFDAHSQSGNDTGQPLFAEDLIVNALRSFSNTLSPSSSSKSYEVFQVPSNACVISEVSEENESINTPDPRKTSETWTEGSSNFTDDGHSWRNYVEIWLQNSEFPRITLDRRTEVSSHFNDDDAYSWRKYGQKEILGFEFPRGYYRCTHRHVQGCPATKRVQRLSYDPSLFEITYRGHHICKGPHPLGPLLAPFILDSPSPRDDSILLSNHTSLIAKQDNNDNPFSPSTFTSVNHEQKLPGEDDVNPHGHSHDDNSNNNNNQPA